MSNAVTVTLALADGCLAARSRLGEFDGPEVFLPAPEAPPSGWWDGAESQELVLEALALLHLPSIATLVFAIGGDDDAAAGRLRRRYTGTHVVRNTECRSQTLGVRVHDVVAEGSGSRTHERSPGDLHRI